MMIKGYKRELYTGIKDRNYGRNKGVVMTWQNG